MKVCVYCLIEVEEIRHHEKVWGRGPTAHIRFKHKRQVDPTGEPWCGRENLSDEEVQDEPA